ncbi:hypothetical protein [Streptomyces sp. MH60]|uniref:hypothetical protein n=1 Tax=Streptomyces sp. MH60 TaxID=1940758 RepID=UPI0010570E57|nr:hypothetical protein [Streptomyces sp. MH60]
MAFVGGGSLVAEVTDARRIDASPVQANGVIDRVVHVKGGTNFRVSYRIDGQRFATEDLPVGQGTAPTEPTLGTTVCVEAAAAAPKTVRLCGQKYPSGDDVIPAKGLLALAGVAGTVMAAGWIVVTGRQQKRDSRRAGSAYGAGPRP